MNFDRSLDAPPGIEMRLSPLVSRVLAPNPGPFTFRGTGVYIVGQGPCVAVIDPGPLLAGHVENLQRVLAPRRISHILVTHTHRDHSPAAQALKLWSGAPTYGVPLAARAVSADLQEAMVDEAHDHDFVPDIVVRDGMRIEGDGFELECVATPGHTANHMCYGLAAEGALFSGDHVMRWSTSVIAPPDGNMGDYLASLEKLAARGDKILYPTHGSPIANPRDWLGQLIAHRRMRQSQIVAALAEGPQTVRELAARLYPDIEPALRPAAGQQIAAHLEHLASRAEAVPENGYWRLKI
ncbi:MAG TPA: MBL fold metallo-hydrolase [Rhizomicrobium sp.]|nr:MBL fold metallo-hydrolase [Rhizomicrobium sp.]